MNRLTADSFATRLTGAGLTGRRLAEGSFLYQCPAHDDSDPSLKIDDGRDRLLLHCFANCAYEAIMGAAGFDPADGFEGNGHRNGEVIPLRRPTKDTKPKAPLPTDDQWARWRTDLERLLNGRRTKRFWSFPVLERLGAGWDKQTRELKFPVHDEHGDLQTVVKFPAVDSDRRKVDVLAGRGRNLFPRPEAYPDTGPIWFVEGEKDAITLVEMGLPAVGLPGTGTAKTPEKAAKWAARFKQFKAVNVVFDADDEGRGCAALIGAALADLGVEVRVVDIDPAGEKPKGYDVSDVLRDACATVPADEGITAARTFLEARAAGTEPVVPVAPIDSTEVATETASLLERIRVFTRRFVVLTAEQLIVYALWVLHTHAIDAAEATPYLQITSAERESGKTRLGRQVTGALAANTQSTANATVAAVFRVIGEGRCTLQFDEMDAIWSGKSEKSEELRGIINAGHTRGETVLRCVGEGSKQTVVRFEVFCPKALMGIGAFPDTVASRSVPIRLKKRARHEPLERARDSKIRTEGRPIKEAAATWAHRAVPLLTSMEPPLPDELGDRAQDGAEPLLAIADLAGGAWPELGRDALITLYRGERVDSADDTGRQVLRACRLAFGEGIKAMSTHQLVAAINGLEEFPFGGWNDSKGISASQLGKKLKQYEISTKPVRPTELEDPSKPIARGYRREYFEDAWERYLAEDASQETADSDGDVTDVTHVTGSSAEGATGLFEPTEQVSGLVEAEDLLEEAERLEGEYGGTS